jgi:hypothetical protein
VKCIDTHSFVSFLGIDPRLWKQAQLDNPNPEKYIPVPMIGFGEVRWRMRCQEQETKLHQAFLDRVAEDIAELQRRHTATVAKIAEYRRKFLDLEHRVLQVYLCFVLLLHVKPYFILNIQILIKIIVLKTVYLQTSVHNPTKCIWIQGL